MQLNTHTDRPDAGASRLNMPMIMGYVFLGIVFLGAISAVYYWEKKSKAQGAFVPKHVESGEQTLVK
jgi:hypothetical protein